MRFPLVAMLLLPMLAAGLCAQEKAAPDFTLPDLDGQNYSLADNIGTGPILINFWATWCIPCHAEMKALKPIYQKYAEQGLTILSISVDDTKTVNKVRGQVRSKRYPYTVLLDTNSEVFQLYQGTNPPHSVLIDYEGNIVYTSVGYRKGAEKKLEAEIARLIEAHEQG